MSVEKRLLQVYIHAKIIPFNNESKIIIISDCHRGGGNTADNFLPNQNVFYASLEYYYKKDFTYIEIGDGDELWENRDLCRIIDEHSDVFWLMSKFYGENRMHMVAGNHDIVKLKKKFSKKCLSEFYCENENCYMPLFPNIKIEEGIILEHSESQQRVFLTHGHQGDLFNDTLWPVNRFLVRYIWGPLQLIGIKAPTGPSKNYKKRDKTEKELINFANKKEEILICGHTHRPVFTNEGEGYYFNDGSCVHPRSITSIEIAGGNITLVKWSVKTKEDRTLYVAREILDGPAQIKNYAKINKDSV